jgi:ABC-type nitrate/sulfonate/bicarbonate transport system substrate-binding protein
VPAHRTLAAAGLAAAVLTAGCSASPHPPTIAQIHRQQGAAAGRALSVGHGTAVITPLPTVQLGLLTSAAGGTGLTAQALGYFGQELGNHLTLHITSLATPQAQDTALTTGRLDAAYLTPAAAITAWHATHGQIRIISGAAISPGGATAAVLAVTTRFLTTHPTWATALLRAQIRATLLLATDPAAGRHAAATELATLAGPAAAARATAPLAALQYTDNPQPQAILNQASTAGQITGIFDLTPLNTLLRASGLPTIRS